MEETKTCTRCGIEKACDQFYASMRGSRCKACLAEYVRARKRDGLHKRRTPEQKAAYRRATGEVAVPYVPKTARLAKAAERRAARAAYDEAIAAWADWVHNRAPEWWLYARAHIVEARIVGSKVWYKTASANQITAYRRKEAAKSRLLYHRDVRKHRAKVKQFKVAHPRLVSKWTRDRQAHLDTRSDGTLTKEAVVRLMAEACKCAYCQKVMSESEKRLDHVIPLCKGGWHSISNVAVCCRACNESKGGRTPAEWREAA